MSIFIRGRGLALLIVVLSAAAALAQAPIAVRTHVTHGDPHPSAPPHGASDRVVTARPPKRFDVPRVPPAAASPVVPRRDEEEADALLSDIDPATMREMKRHVSPAPIGPDPLARFGRAAVHDAAAANALADPLAPTSLVNFNGANDGNELDGYIHTPPDPVIAAGPNQIVQVVNSLISAYSKTGTLLYRVSQADWFNDVCTNCVATDPRIVYDATAGHWILIFVYSDGGSVSQLLMSVSQTSDATGSWWNYSFDASLSYSGENTWADYPDVGIDGIAAASGGAVYVTTNQYSFSTNSFKTAVLYILPKSALYTGAVPNAWRVYDPHNADTTKAFSLRPATTFGNPGGEFLVNTQNNGSSISLWRVNPTYPPTAVDWTLQATLAIGGYSIPPDAAQPGTTDLVSTLDNRLYNAVWRSNRLYTAFTEGHNWGSGTVAAIRDVAINTSTNAVETNETFGSDGLHYYSPAITADGSSNVVLVFSRSSGSEYAGARYSGRLASETLTQASATLHSGSTALLKQPGASSSRWGDYEGVAIDPSDANKIWIAAEYATSLGYSYDYNWGTAIAQVQFASSGPSAPTAMPATSVAKTSFTANWNAASGAPTGYRLDVSTSSAFASFVSGYQDLDVGNVLSRSVSGLTANITYYYRVRAYNASGTSASSAAISVVTASTFQINATFDSSITSSGSAAAIIATINQMIASYQTLFSDAVTANILFRYSTTAPDGGSLPGSALATSNSVVYTSFGWTTVINALKADASTANDSTANASLPASSLTPNLDVHSANGRAIGLNTPPAMSSDASIGGTFDGIVTLNAGASFQFTRPVTSGNYDALRALEHEVDEVLGFGSSIGVFTSLEPQDLFSWSSAGTRSMSTSGSRYFSINSGTTNIVGFNQSSNGDYGDWLSGSCPQATPYVQNAFSCSGQQSDVTATSPEGINLDVIGYNLSTTSTLVDAPTSVVATAGSTTSVAISWSAPSGTAPSRYHVYRSSNHTTYTQVNAESTSGTSFTDSTASPNTAYLYKVRSVDSASAESADSTVDLATTTIFTDSTLSAQITKVKAAHITELRTAVNAVRTLAGLSAYTFTDPSLTATVTGVKKVHITDLRTALDAARSTLGLTPLTYTDSTITIGATKVKGAHTTELRNGVK